MENLESRRVGNFFSVKGQIVDIFVAVIATQLCLCNPESAMDNGIMEMNVRVCVPIKLYRQISQAWFVGHSLLNPGIGNKNHL